MNSNTPWLVPELLSMDQVPCSKCLIGDRRGNFVVYPSFLRALLMAILLNIFALLVLFAMKVMHL